PPRSWRSPHRDLRLRGLRPGPDRPDLRRRPAPRHGRRGLPARLLDPPRVHLDLVVTEPPHHDLERSRPARLARAALALLALAAIASASVATAQDGVSRRRMGVRWVEGAPRVHFSATDLADED